MSGLTVAIPILNEEETIPRLLERLAAAVAAADLPIKEFLFIDDGSTDRSVELLQEAAVTDPRIRVLVLSRNFGHQIAISAAIDHAAGDAIIIMDADLQDPPEVLRGLYEKWQDGYEIVYAVRTKRKKESFFKRVTASVFYRLLRTLAEIDIPVDAGDFCLLDRKVIDALRQMPERSRYVRGLRAWVGFRSAALPYEREERFAGETKYPFRKMLALAINGVLGFSTLPLRLATYLGILVAFVCCVLVVILLAIKIIYGSTFADPGWTSLMLAIFFMGSVQLFVIGVMGEYIGRIYRESQQRPLYLVRDTIGAGTKREKH